MKKRILALVFALILALSAVSMAHASDLKMDALEALINKKKESAAASDAASITNKTVGTSDEFVIGVVEDGVVWYVTNEADKADGFDVKVVSAALTKANYRKFSFVSVSADRALEMLDNGEITLLIGYPMENEKLLRADHQAQGEEGKYLRTAAYLSGKKEVSPRNGAKINLGMREFFAVGSVDNEKLIDAYDRAFEKMDADGTVDSIWDDYFNTSFFYDLGRGIRRTALGIWRQFRMNLIEEDRYQMILKGLGTTILIAICAAVLGVVFGCVLALMRLSNIRIGKWYVLRSLATIYVDVIRGTPVVVQLMIMYYIVFVSPNISKVTVAIITFGLNSAAYVSEMVRGGILAVDKGQTEAGRSLGLSAGATMYLIVLPQTIKIIIPSLFNEIIMLLKETSVVGFIGLMDLTKAGDYIRSRTYSAFFPLLTVAAVYLVIVTVLTRVFERVERRMRQSDIR